MANLDELLAQVAELRQEVAELRQQVAGLASAKPTSAGRSVLALDTTYRAPVIGYVSVVKNKDSPGTVRLLVGEQDPPTTTLLVRTPGFDRKPLGAVIREGEDFAVDTDGRPHYDCLFTPFS